MLVGARRATSADVPSITLLYRDLEEEQAALRSLWPLADGVDEPIDDSFAAILDDPDSMLVVGSIDHVILGFCWMRVEPLLSQAKDRVVAVSRLIHTVAEARGVGIGDAMLTLAMDEMRARGIALFDARVSPGHRNAKNFYEAHGFSARLIIMHHDDDV